MLRPERPKRPRALQACEVCRARKNRCSEDLPCIYCVEHDLECVYTRAHHDKRRKIVSQVTQSHPGARELETVHERNRSHEYVDGTHESPADVRSDAASASSAKIPLHHYPPNSTSIQAPTGHGHSMAQQSTITPRDSAADIMETNSHTMNLEFYGASSSVAFLRNAIADSDAGEHACGESERSLASLLHNTNFQPHSTPASPLSETVQGSNEHFYFRVARRFLDAYFCNIHFIEPIFDEEDFFARCEDLWFDKPEKQPRSFIALYYVTLSLGSLVMIWDDRNIYGADRFSWSRKFFNEAVGIVTQLGSATDLEMVQCYYMMGKVCQHELNPHVAYLYSGQATRTALAIGLNRPIDKKISEPKFSLSASKTWWAVYCLDIQTSFALGRPDSLGPDQYHTQDLPGAVAAAYETGRSTTAPHMLQFVPCMVELSRIMRRVSLLLYTLPCTVREKVFRARELDAELLHWLQTLPPQFQSLDRLPKEPSLKPRPPASYVNKQYVVLMIRYYNLRSIIHGKFLTISEAIEGDMQMAVRECQQKCIDSAGHSIHLMHDTFQNHSFFQTWWYNSTYTLFAVSILLTAVFHKFPRSNEALESLLGQIDQAIAILEVMEECVVTRNATVIIKRTLARAKKVSQVEVQNNLISDAQDLQRSTWMDLAQGSAGLNSADASRGNVGSMAESELDWMNAFPIDDGQTALFWVEWTQNLDALGV